MTKSEPGRVKKKVVISCGPIPARLDSVKYVTNRFKGGLAFKTAQQFIDWGYDVTLVIWKNTSLPVVNGQKKSEYWMRENVHIVTVDDVFDYYKWFEENAANYDAFIMAAAVANLTPSSPYEGKFPSHLYRVGESFNIQFEIAPRAIDIVKKINPRACLIGYKLFDAQTDEELIGIARHTLADAKANIIFANTPETAKSRKIAVMADNSAFPVDFDGHLELMRQAIEADYFKTEIITIQNNTDQLRFAEQVVRMYDRTFNGFGTVAVPVACGGFMTTSRGHKGEPVYVSCVDMDKRLVYATGKATLNAPALSALIEANPGCIVVHRHSDDPLFSHRPFDSEMPDYTFPGTKDEIIALEHNGIVCNTEKPWRIKLTHHGDLQVLPIKSIDWSEYYKLFPEKYFKTPDTLKEVMSIYNHGETLEVGCNTNCACKYAYDKFVTLPDKSISWEEVQSRQFDFMLARNCAAYLTDEEIETLLAHTAAFAANVFFRAPKHKGDERECAILADKHILHGLRLPTDELMTHSFFARRQEDWERLGLTVTRYGHNSALLTKDIPVN